MELISWLLLVVAVLVVYALVGRGVWRGLRWALVEHDRRQAAMRSFAQQHNLVFAPQMHRRTDGPLDGSMIQTHVYADTFTDKAGGFEFGDAVVGTLMGPELAEEVWTYASIKLDRTLPHIVLDAHANDSAGAMRVRGHGASTMPRALDSHQVLQLEGDFSDHFSLYVPAGHERDALYVFTPDLMALLIDESVTFDAEIIDDHLLVYSHSLSVGDASTRERIMRIIERVGGRVHHRTHRFAVANGAQPGLRHRWSVNRHVIRLHWFVALSLGMFGVLLALLVLRELR